MTLPASVILTVLRQYPMLLPEQLLTAERLATTLSSAKELTAALVERGWLTKYQADELSEGRGAGLIVGQYLYSRISLFAEPCAGNTNPSGSRDALNR